jgi:hypothetical protein
MPNNTTRPARPPATSGRRPTNQSRARKRPAAPPPPSTRLTRLNREHPMLLRLIPIALVVVIIAVMIVIKTTGSSGGGGTGHTSNGSSALPAGVLSHVTSVTPATLAAVGVPSGIAPPSAIKGNPAPLTASNGRPEVLYMGAEYCPYCAAERWAMVVALSRFGTFNGLKATHSGSLDVFPGTNTFSFYKSTYTSSYLDFTPVELKTNEVVGGAYTNLQTPTAAQNALTAKYDVAPYTTQPGSIPFLDIGNRYLFIGASYTPQVLQGLSMQTIAADLNDPTSQVALAVDGTANEMTAALCSITGNQPASVCSSPTVAAAATTLAK